MKWHKLKKHRILETELIKNLKWSYATKEFDPSKTLTKTDLKIIKEAIQLSPSSHGLQPYKVLIVENPEVKAHLKQVAWGQNQITDASHLFVFCSYQDLTEDHIDELFDLKATTYNKEKSTFQGYISFMKAGLKNKTPEARRIWNSRQVYLGLANLLNVCAELKIDACPMEGFDTKQFGEILDLNSKGLDAIVLAAVGYRSKQDQFQHFPKLKKPKNSLFEIIS
ncbi:NAD(P)H-dependent oxidoreductase [Wenyingzhuangia sp. 2_MG-2023]|uniref:NAD(P)H-dependent oxidoreductase n=1 Tax=Wenyingzhuangia sp. 2_MG-2023 TaxID=3062639 RepID=UPI0026E3E528|nr:NAD(P)H-dependent oxidoreductase [Wenyingzhuangia sp. 2_MG-2023]MDO6739107.1 NAD(P)H-dependent oxidoreductase [Wenyingzhuangia sp. 2_MG-2023]MDO6802969.1 NAD(P)H-dependent oxidoreductase [Wenyingzhuangia sp. 1_MG-2023]